MTRKRGHRHPPSETLASHLRDVRLLRRLTQDDVAEQMRAMGHATWSRATVSEIERRGRSVTVDEIVSLAVVFRVPPPSLMESTRLTPAS